MMGAMLQEDSSRSTFESRLEAYGPRDFTIRFWDGREWKAEIANPAFVVVFHDPTVLADIANDEINELSLCERYIRGDFDIEGDLEAAMRLGEFFLEARDDNPDNGATPRKPRLANCTSSSSADAPLSLSGPLHSLARDRQAIWFHYNVSNDFYSLWLDKRMMYSCGRFFSEDEELESAQTHKLAQICQKLNLKDNERVLDIGCGWGGFILFAAQECGAESVGITLSAPQAEIANRRAGEAHIEDHCRAMVCDYRELAESQRFDKLVSTGMVEHVGDAHLRQYFDAAYRLLRSGGAFLVSGIGRSGCSPAENEPTFITRYVFPDGEIVPVHRMLRHAEEAGFEVRSVENLRENYALTLRRWVSRLEAYRDQALQFVDERTYRIWRLYMAASAYYFAQGGLHIYETLLAKR